MVPYKHSYMVTLQAVAIAGMSCTYFQSPTMIVTSTSQSDIVALGPYLIYIVYTSWVPIYSYEGPKKNSTIEQKLIDSEVK